MVNCEIAGEEANMLDLGLATGIGVVSGLIGGKGADGAKLRGIVKTSKEVLKTAVSPKKIAMYTGKIVSCVKEAIADGGRLFTSVFASNVFNYFRRRLTSSAV